MDNQHIRKIGIMGGTFDPIHNGHLLIAQSAADEFQLEQVIFVPTGISPHKCKFKVTDAERRSIMVQKAIADNRYFQLSKIEIRNPKVSYTYETLEKLSVMHPDTEFYFIMGEDSLKDFECWKEPGEICKNATLLVALRDDIEGEELKSHIWQLRKKYSAEIFPLHSPNYSVSSRDIRARVKEGKSIRYLVPETVEQFIKLENLYHGRKF